MNKESNQKAPRRGHRDDEVLPKIKEITAKGSDVEVRRQQDGTFALYEIRKKAV